MSDKIQRILSGGDGISGRFPHKEFISMQYSIEDIRIVIPELNILDKICHNDISLREEKRLLDRCGLPIDAVIILLRNVYSKNSIHRRQLLITEAEWRACYLERVDGKGDLCDYTGRRRSSLSAGINDESGNCEKNDSICYPGHLGVVIGLVVMGAEKLVKHFVV